MITINTVGPIIDCNHPYWLTDTAGCDVYMDEDIVLTTHHDIGRFRLYDFIIYAETFLIL